MTWTSKLPPDLFDSIMREFSEDSDILPLFDQEEGHRMFGAWLALRAEKPVFLNSPEAYLNASATRGHAALVAEAETSIRRKQIWQAYALLKLFPEPRHYQEA